MTSCKEQDLCGPALTKCSSYCHLEDYFAFYVFHVFVFMFHFLNTKALKIITMGRSLNVNTIWMCSCHWPVLEMSQKTVYLFLGD